MCLLGTNTGSALLLLYMEVWSCACRASVGLPDLAAPLGACVLPLPQLLWDSAEFPHAPGAIMLSVHLLGVFQRSGPFLIPPPSAN